MSSSDQPSASQALQLPITRRNNSSVCKIEWRPAAYHTVLQILRHPVYAGAYVFGRTSVSGVFGSIALGGPSGSSREGR